MPHVLLCVAFVVDRKSGQKVGDHGVRTACAPSAEAALAAAQLLQLLPGTTEI
jgi:hypothetical protein